MKKIGPSVTPRVPDPSKDRKRAENQQVSPLSTQNSFKRLAQSRFQEMLANRSALLDFDDEEASAESPPQTSDQ